MAKRTTVDDLRARASLFWPAELTVKEARASIIPRLIQTQEKFIGVLYVADSTPTAWSDVLAATEDMPGNLFLKHLLVLSDMGGEQLKRLRPALRKQYSDSPMTFTWRDRRREYVFRSLTGRGSWSNKDLFVDGAGLAGPREPTDGMFDAAMLVLHGATILDPGVPADALQNCLLGGLLGRKDELDQLVRQRYIWVSRITGGAKSNRMGQLAQRYVRERLKNLLPGWDFSRKTIPGVSQTAGRTDMSFDFVAESPSGRHCAVEVSFQVTTNSVIERKAGQAADRQNYLHRQGHRIAYVIDGAGNFERRSAVETICTYSDCIVPLTDEGIRELSEFLAAEEE